MRIDRSNRQLATGNWQLAERLPPGARLGHASEAAQGAVCAQRVLGQGRAGGITRELRTVLPHQAPNGLGPQVAQRWPTLGAHALVLKTHPGIAPKSAILRLPQNPDKGRIGRRLPDIPTRRPGIERPRQGKQGPRRGALQPEVLGIDQGVPGKGRIAPLPMALEHTIIQARRRQRRKEGTQGAREGHGKDSAPLRRAGRANRGSNRGALEVSQWLVS